MGNEQDFVENPEYKSQGAGSLFVDNPAYSSIPADPAHSQQPTGDDPYANSDKEDVATQLGDGIIQGISSTGAGVSDIVDKGLGLVNEDWGKPGAVNNFLHRYAGDNHTRTTAESIGYGGETLVEFMMGDAALKGLSMADKLVAVAKWMKIAEKSPKLMAALHLGANGLKAQAELSGEELAVVRQYPKLAKLLGITFDSARVGAVQTAQTTARTGDIKQGAEEGLGAAAVGGVAEYGLGKAGELFSKAGKAAKTVEGMNEAAANAPSEQGVFTAAADTINTEKSAVEDQFNKHVQDLETERAAGEKAANERLAGRKDNAESMAQDRKSQGAAQFEDQQARIARGQEAAQRYTQTQLVNGLDHLAGAEPVATEDLAQQVNEGLDRYEAGHHTRFENAINDEEHGVVPRLEGQTRAVTDSPISTGANHLLNTPIEGDHEAVADMKALSGDNLKPAVRQRLEDLRDGMRTRQVQGADGQMTNQRTSMAPWTAKSLVDYRQAVRKAAIEAGPRGDINRHKLLGLLDYIDQTLDQMAEHAGDPGVSDAYRAARATYKTEQAYLDTKVADKLRLTSPDQALGDVNKYLLSGNNPAKLSTLRTMIGEGPMQELARSKVGQWRTLAETDPAKFVKEFDAMTPQVREAFFGPEMTSRLEQLAETYSRTSVHADDYATELLAQAKQGNTTSKAVTRQLSGNTGPGEKQLGGLIGEGIKSAHARELADVASRYDDAVNVIKESQDKMMEPFSGSFMKQLSEGRINEALLKGQVDAQDIIKLKRVIGSDQYQAISDGIFQRAIADASPKGAFNPEKLINWWTGIKPEVRTELFDLSDPAKLAKYKAVMDQVQESVAVKRMVKYFGAYPAVGGAALGVAGLAAKIGSGFAGLLGGIVAGSAGVATEAKLVPTIVEWIANHPNTWAALRKGSEMAQAPMAKAAAKGVKVGAAKAGASLARILSGTSNSLAGTQ